MGTLPGASLNGWAQSQFGQAFNLHWRPASIYLFLLAAGVAGDVASCDVAGMPAFWQEIMPQLHYLAVIFAAARFGVAVAVASACVAGALHTVVLGTACNQGGSQAGQWLMFAAVAFMAAWASRGVTRVAGRTELRPDISPWNAGSSLSGLGRMMPEVVHQFRTPIASIEGAGFVLEDGDLSPEKRQEFVGIIRKECNRLEHLVGLLDFTQSRLSEFRQVEVPHLLDQLVGHLRETAGPGVEFRSFVPREIPPLNCDPELIQFALQSLTANAMRALPRDGQVIELSANSDSGAIAIHMKARLKQSASRPDSALIQEPGGLDLGVVQQIVGVHGGSVRIDPTPHGGLAVSLLLPSKAGER